MGMFDTIKCSYDIGILKDIDCQTKDIDPCFGGTMSFYWIDPVGHMWYSDYQGTTALRIPNEPGKRMECAPTGFNGKVTRCYVTDYITIYDSMTHPDGYVDFEYCRIHLVDGILQDFEYINKQT